MSDGAPPKDPEDEMQKKTLPTAPVAKLTATLLNGEGFETPTLETKSKDFDGALDGANDEALAIRLAFLEEEHRDLDAAIAALELNAGYERLTIARLKKKKLHLKDEIQAAKDSMLPDIIA